MGSPGEIRRRIISRHSARAPNSQRKKRKAASSELGLKFLVGPFLATVPADKMSTNYFKLELLYGVGVPVDQSCPHQSFHTCQARDCDPDRPHHRPAMDEMPQNAKSGNFAIRFLVI
ncbi:hypothetical protein ACLOJK_017040 [Asimina triloba]